MGRFPRRAAIAATAAFAVLSAWDGRATGSPPSPSSPSSPVERGRAIAEVHCSRCHATGREGASPMEGAVPFRDLERSYPVETLAEALAEGIVTGHPQMPVFAFAPGEIDDLLAYLDGLR